MMLTIALLAVIHLFAAVQDDAITAAERLIHRQELPSPTPAPPIPNIDVEARPAAPDPTPIDRDAALADHLSAEGQVARYWCDAEQGELSLFELVSYGMSRGWESTAGIEIADEQGAILAKASRSGPAVYEIFLPFTAPHSGRFEVRITALKEWFRYSLTRHSGYFARQSGDVIAIDDRSLVHGHLASVGDVAIYRLDVAAGEIVSLKVMPTLERHQKQWRVALKEQIRADQVSRLRSADRAERLGDADMNRSRSRTRQSTSTPQFQLTVLVGEQHIAGDAHYVRFGEAAATSCRVRVSAIDGLDGGRFDLIVERNPATAAVAGYVGDDQDEPVPGVAVRFLREPDFDPVGVALSADDGTYHIDVPPGDYTVLFAAPTLPQEEARTSVSTDREVNLVYPWHRD